MFSKNNLLYSQRLPLRTFRRRRRTAWPTGIHSASNLDNLDMLCSNSACGVRTKHWGTENIATPGTQNHATEVETSLVRIYTACYY
jgi:hypothetical protein